MPPIPVISSNGEAGPSSAADFLRSISAESSISFGASTPTQDGSSARTVPELPISAKVSLIDAQIDNLEAQIQSTILAHSEQLKQRAVSSRKVKHDLNDLWQSINQTSSRLVAVSSEIVPIATQYHNALAQSQMSSLLVTVLSDLVSVLKQIEQLETKLQKHDLAGIEIQLPQVEAALTAIAEQNALQSLSAIIELQHRLQHIKTTHSSLSDASQKPPDTPKTVEPGRWANEPISGSAAVSSSNSNALDRARKLIIAKGAEDGWKAVVVPSPHEIVAAPPPQDLEEPAPPEAHPVPPMREGLIRPASPLTRSSSNSSGVTSRRQKAKLGARVLRPQDQLGSGPFNAQDAGGDGSDWGLDDDDDDLPLDVTAPQSVSMHSTSSNSSLQRAALAMQHEDDGDEAWGLEEEPTTSFAPPSNLSHTATSSRKTGSIKSPKIQEDEDGAWGLDDEIDNDASALPTGNFEQESSPLAARKPLSPSPASSFTSAAQSFDDADDAWGIEDQDEIAQDAVANYHAQPDLATPLVSQYKDGEIWGASQTTAPVPQRAQINSLLNNHTDQDDSMRQLPEELRPTVEAGRPFPTSNAALASTQKETCTISQRSIDLMQLAQQTMDEAIRLLSLDTAEARASRPDLILATVGDIFELHRSLMPVAHGEVLRDVPSLAMQFFNDCEYLARELIELVASRTEKVSAAWARRDADAAAKWQNIGLVKLQQQAVLTRSLGQRWFEAQITAQSKVLHDTLSEADGFARTFDDDRFARCERCVEQVVQTLEQLGKAWRPILAPSHFNPALGRLVDLVFQKVLHDVLDLEDIGESESEKIGGLIKRLGGLESLFTDETTQQSSAPLFVPSWFKTSYLIEILTGSLVDIEFLAFEARALVDYSRKELTGLIKALFSDTNNRSKLLHKIEMAAPDVLTH